jgi:hypothetical protein
MLPEDAGPVARRTNRPAVVTPALDVLSYTAHRRSTVNQIGPAMVSPSLLELDVQINRAHVYRSVNGSLAIRPFGLARFVKMIALSATRMPYSLDQLFRSRRRQRMLGRKFQAQPDTMISSGDHRRRARGRDREESQEPTHPVDRPFTFRPAAILRLQQSAGNRATVQLFGAARAKALQRTSSADSPALVTVQRQSQQPLPRPQLRDDLFQLRGVNTVSPRDPTAPAEGTKFWLLDFDAMVLDDSLLDQMLKQQQRLQQLYTGNAPDDAPLSLQIVNTAVNILLSEPQVAPLANRLKLDRFNVVIDPTRNNYGIGATFRF